MTPTFTLQELFIRSQGQPVQVGSTTVIQMDKIPITTGLVTIEFIGPVRPSDGVALKSPDGKIILSDDSSAKLVYLWDDPRYPRTITHRLQCPAGELWIWNIYRIHHFSTLVTVDNFTGDAGMIVERSSANSRIYKCSNSLNGFSPDDLVFRAHWEEE